MSENKAPSQSDFEIGGNLGSPRLWPSGKARIPIPPKRHPVVNELSMGQVIVPGTFQSPTASVRARLIRERHLDRKSRSRSTDLSRSLSRLNGPSYYYESEDLDSSMPVLRIAGLIEDKSNRENIFKRYQPRALSGDESGDLNLEQKTVKVDVGDFDAAMETVSAAIEKERNDKYTGFVLFVVNGETSTEELERYRNRISTIINEHGYIPRYKTNRPNIVFFRMWALTSPRKLDDASDGDTPGKSQKLTVLLPCTTADKALLMVKMQLRLNFPGIIEFVPEEGRYHELFMNRFPDRIVELCREFGYSAMISDEQGQKVECWIPNESEPEVTQTPEMKVQLPSFDAETAERLIRNQLESKFVGNVIFEAEKKFFSKSQMKNYPKRILELCKEYGFHAEIIDKISGSVECEMTGRDEEPIIYELPNDQKIALNMVKQSLMAGDTAGFKPQVGQFSDNLEKLIINTCRAAGKEVEKRENNAIVWKTPKRKNVREIVVSVSPFDRLSAESLIRTHLESTFCGFILFRPAHGLYSSTLMPEFPERVVEMCHDYGFAAKIQDHQHVKCDKTVLNKAEITVKVPSHDEREAGKVLNDVLTSGVPQTVVFVPEADKYDEKLGDFPSKIIEKCKIFGYEARALGPSERQAVECVMRPVQVELPLGDSASLEFTIRRQLYADSRCVYAFVPERTITDKDQLIHFKNLVIRVCKSCGCTTIDCDNDRQLVFCNATGLKRFNSRDRFDLARSNDSESAAITVVVLPTFDERTAESIVRAQLESSFVGIVRFQTKSYKYSETMMKGWPNRILEIIGELGYKGEIVNEVSQIVECVVTGSHSHT